MNRKFIKKTVAVVTITGAMLLTGCAQSSTEQTQKNQMTTESTTTNATAAATTTETAMATTTETAMATTTETTMATINSTESAKPELADRLTLLDTEMQKWANADNLADAKAAAEAVRNLLVGAHGPMYGDADGNGTIEGATDIGLLPGLKGEPGLVDLKNPSSSVEADVLGGPWDNPTERWNEALTAVQNWTPQNNPFPTLESQPMRVFGWASLTLNSNSLDDAHEYSKHGKSHLDVTIDAINDK